MWIQENFDFNSILYFLLVFPGEHRAGSLGGNTRNSCERMRISSLVGINDHTDNMDNPSSREDISEMYVFR